jgi:hypothetical protein
MLFPEDVSPSSYHCCTTGHPPIGDRLFLSGSTTSLCPFLRLTDWHHCSVFPRISCRCAVSSSMSTEICSFQFRRASVFPWQTIVYISSLSFASVLARFKFVILSILDSLGRHYFPPPFCPAFLLGRPTDVLLSVVSAQYVI